MRTTLAIDDDVWNQVRRYAAARSLPLGHATSELLRRSLAGPRATHREKGLHVATLPPDSPRVSGRRVRSLLAEDD